MLKKLELAWKAVWLAVICRIVRIVGRPHPEPDWTRAPVRVLFLRPDRIGDAIVTTGVFREIATRAPNVVLDAVGSPRNRSILERDPHLGTVHVFERGRWSTYPGFVRRLRAARYDAVIDCMVTAPSMTTLLLMLASGARHRIGIAGRRVDDAITVAVPPNRDAVHIIEHLAALGAVFGVEIGSGNWRPRLELGEDERARAVEWWKDPDLVGSDRRPRVLVNVSAGKPARNWPEDRFAAAIEHVRHRHPGAAVVVIGAPAERERVERVAAAAGVRPVATPRLTDAIALVGTADFLLTPDTSIAHVASALGTPAVVMYLRGTGRLWGLYGAPGASLESATGSLVDLPLATVLAAVDEIMAAKVRVS